MAGKPYHGAAHRKLGTPAVIEAERNPAYQCPRCGLTKAEAITQWGPDGAEWIRGHKRRAEHATSPADYQAEHAHCSGQEGAQVRNQMSSTGYDWP